MKINSKNKTMIDEEIQRLVLAEIQSAKDNRQTTKREKNWDRYYGRQLGNEKKGRSQFITRDVMDTIEWMMPFFIRTFASGDPKIDIKIKGQESFVGKALMSQIQDDLADRTPTIFYLFYQWFKDALVSSTAFVKLGWNLDQKTVMVEFDDLSRQNLAQLVSDPDVQVTGVEERPNFLGSTFKTTAEVKQTVEDTVFVENTPHWEFLVSSKARDINDEHGKGQQTEVTLDYLKRINRTRSTDKPYFKHLDEFEPDVNSDQQMDDLFAEKTNYMEDDQLPEVGHTKKGMVEFKEWYTRLDVDGDGYLEDIVCFFGNNRLLRHEVNEEGFIPFVAIRPIIDCYKFHGIAFAELIVEIQNLKTMLFRRILDSFDFQVSGRWRVDPDGSVDLHALYNHTPGGVISGKKGSIEDISPAPFSPGNLTILEYVDTLKENRTGLTKYNQGLDSNTLNKTARGIQAIQSAAMQRMELVARIFAEGLRDFYKKIAMLYQRYSKGFVADVFGQEKEITSEMLQGKVTSTVNMGIQAGVGIEETQKIEHIVAFLMGINEKYPGILTPEKIHNICTRYISSAGFNQIDDFIADLQSYMQQITQSTQQKQQMQAQLIKLQQQMQQMELQIKGKDADTKAKKVESDAYLKSQELEQDVMIEREKLAQDEKDSVRDAEIDMINILTKPTNNK